MRPPPSALATAAFAALAYVLFLASSVTLLAFLGGVPGWRGVDTGPVGPVGEALAVDLLLVLGFGLQHGVMARAGFKRLWTRVVPPAAERSAYVLAASLALLALVLLWRPVPGVLWSVWHPAGALAVRAIFWAGAALVVASTFAIDHLELFGLDRAWRALRGGSIRDGGPRPPTFETPPLYRLVRHPMQLGFLVTFWATPVMTVGRLALAVALTAYVLVGVALEERDLVRAFGEAYRAYRERVPALLPLGRGFGRGWGGRRRVALPLVAMPLAVVLPALVLAAGDAVAPAGVTRGRIVVDGLPREYLLRAPRRPRANPSGAPIVLAFHGASGDGALMRALAGDALERWADARGALVVYPQGVGRTWHDCRRGIPYEAARRGVDDVAFVRALVDTLARAHGADRERVLALGFSNGAHLALRVALEAPELARAVAAVGASVPAARSLACRVPGGEAAPAVLLVAGTADPINPFDGGAVRLPTGRWGGEVRSAHGSAAYLARLAGHGDTAARTELFADGTARLRWEGAGGPPVALVAVRGGGHELARRLAPARWWPGAQGVDAVEEALAFFDRAAAMR